MIGVAAKGDQPEPLLGCLDYVAQLRQSRVGEYLVFEERSPLLLARVKVLPADALKRQTPAFVEPPGTTVEETPVNGAPFGPRKIGDG